MTLTISKRITLFDFSNYLIVRKAVFNYSSNMFWPQIPYSLIGCIHLLELINVTLTISKRTNESFLQGYKAILSKMATTTTKEVTGSACSQRLLALKKKMKLGDGFSSLNCYRFPKASCLNVKISSPNHNGMWVSTLHTNTYYAISWFYCCKQREWIAF